MRRQKFRVRVETPSRIAIRDVRFDFADVQTKNPRMQGRTPLVLYTKDPIAPHRKVKKGWWEE